MRGFRGSLTVRAAHAAFIIMVLYMMHPVVACADMSEEEKNFLLMYFKEEELQVVSSTRSLKPISRVAENMTVVTAADIERMNAHTLADVLNTVNGVQVWFVPSTPGNNANVSIQGSDQRHVTVLIDGVVINSLNSDIADVGIIPVQNIERIEIVKGPASSVWGSALGGVINVITKNPPDSGVHGMASESYGSSNTEDFRTEISGKKGDAGFYVTAGGLHSNGLRFGSDVMNKNMYGKFSYAVTPSTDIGISLSYLKGRRERGDFRSIDDDERDKNEQYFGTLSLTSRLTNRITLNVAATALRQRQTVTDDLISTGENSSTYIFDDSRYGVNAKLVWKLDNQTIVAGTDYNYGVEKSNGLENGKQHQRRNAIFANDTLTFGNLALIPGIRYETTDTNGDFTSPSLGATYQLAKKTIIRATAAKGFNVPELSKTFGEAPGFVTPNPNLRLERVTSYQVGIESGELKYLWIKGSVFRHDVKDYLDYDQLPDGTFMAVNKHRQRRQGFETEVRTAPVYNTTLSAGATFIYAKDRDTNEVIFRIPKYSYDVGLSYDDNKSFRAQLKGRYVWWNAEDFTQSKYSNFIVELSVAKTILKHADQKLDLFLTAHNLLNANEYMVYYYRNAGRWAEVGLCYKF